MSRIMHVGALLYEVDQINPVSDQDPMLFRAVLPDGSVLDNHVWSRAAWDGYGAPLHPIVWVEPGEPFIGSYEWQQRIHGSQEWVTVMRVWQPPRELPMSAQPITNLGVLNPGGIIHLPDAGTVQWGE